MLETDEVDNDFFTPIASTSLANIFSKPSLPDTLGENESLKYVPKPQVNDDFQKPASSKATLSIFACALVAYEWVNNVYISKGKIGFAVIKIIKNSLHNIILYDSSKTTLSQTTITPKFEVTVKGSNFLLYYDDFQKYWSLHGSENDIIKIIETLKSLDVIIRNLPKTSQSETKESVTLVLKSIENMRKDVGSDTDSSINARTKSAILNRMANMGYSVLPLQTNLNDKTSDSSDTDKTDNHNKAIKQRPVKSIVKRNFSEKNLTEPRLVEMHKTVIAPRIDYDVEDRLHHILPVSNSSVLRNINPSANDLNLFFTEQRISNSELRVNITRMTDKVDQILNKINNVDGNDKNDANINNVILQKLLKEYECKIETYENQLKKLEVDKKIYQTGTFRNDSSSENNLLKCKIIEFETALKEKNDCIDLLMEEVNTLKKSTKTLISPSDKELLLSKISPLEDNLLTKNKMLTELSSEKRIETTDIKSDMHSEIKNIMNETFQAIAVNFENDKTYSGEAIKTVIATVIKKVTIDSLNK